jgi:hypothetical protein
MIQFIRIRPVWAAFLVLILMLPAGLRGQQFQVRGTVVDDQTREPIPAVAVQLIDPSGRKLLAVLTDAAGKFQITPPAPGRYRLRGERLGYFATQSGELVLDETTKPFEIRMSPHPVLLDSIMVSVKSEGQKLKATEQLIHGRLLDDETRGPIPGGSVELWSLGRRIASTIADDHGLFRVVTPIPGTYVLRAERIGYQPNESPELRMMLGDTVRLDFYLSTHAVLLAPITVTASARKWLDRSDQSGIEDLFNRMKRYGNSKFGNFLLRDSLEYYANKGYRPSDLIDLHMFRSPHGCREGSADLYLNGAPFLSSGSVDDAFSLSTLEAIEMFTAPTIPGEFVSSVFGTVGFGMPCKVIVLWTRR